MSNMEICRGSMVILGTKFCTFRHTYTNMTHAKIFKRNYLENTQQKLKRGAHPYKCIHPWKSLEEFSDDLLSNIIYNKDGLVALNKPYGIKRQGLLDNEVPLRNQVPNGVNYTLENTLPYLREKLKYPKLNIVKAPEMYMSGVTLLATNQNVEKALWVAFNRSHFFSNTYWVVTTGVPRQLKDSKRLAIKIISSTEFKLKKAIITSSWSKNDEKHGKIKIFKTEYEVLSNSTLNLCSLIKLKASTERKHAIRLFTSTFLYSPILGDNIYASRIQKVGDTYVNIDPFLTCPGLPKLDKRLLGLLDVSPNQQVIIPAHIHLKSVCLPFPLGDVIIEAPLMPYFEFTCRQLEFKCLRQNNVS